MIWGLLGLLIGLLLGYVFPLTIPVEYARYTAVGIMGILDALFGGWKATLQKEYDAMIFLSGLFFNMFLAMIITWLGDRLSLDLYLAVLIFFTFRIFTNIGIIRYSFLTRFLGKKKVEEKITEEK
jgi:small basic protein